MSYETIRFGGEKLIIGRDSISSLAKLNGIRAVIFSARSMVKTGVFDRCVKLLQSAGLSTQGYFNYSLNPTFEEALEGANFLKLTKPDLILSLGGGTVMDLGKLMWVLYENDFISTLAELLAKMDELVLGEKAKFICIPTTSGSGSEVSKSSVITDSTTRIKVPIRNLDMVPSIAILDPLLTISLPKEITAETGMDALTHHLESFVSIKANPITNAVAKAGAIDAIEWLPIAYKDGSNVDAREKMMFCSTMGAFAFSSASLGLSHGMAHAIGARLNISHSLFNAILLPLIIRFNSDNATAREKYFSIAKHFDEEDLVDIIISLRDLLCLPKTIKEVINNDQSFMEQMPGMIVDVANDGLTKLNCIQPTNLQIENLLMRAYFGE